MQDASIGASPTFDPYPSSIKDTDGCPVIPLLLFLPNPTL